MHFSWFSLLLAHLRRYADAARLLVADYRSDEEGLIVGGGDRRVASRVPGIVEQLRQQGLVIYRLGGNDDM